MESVKTWAAIALLTLLVVASHWPGVGAELTFDDKDYIGKNVSILGLRTALDAFDAPFPPHRPDHGMYRPLTNFSYALDVAVWGPNPFGFHVTNVLLYLLVVWGVYALCRLYLPSPGFALASAVLFSVHPVHCEAVDNITGRSEVLALLFAIVSIYCFMRVLKASSASPSGKSTLASLRPGLVFLPPALLAYALASLSKEIGVVLPGVLAIHFLAFGLRTGESVRERVLRGAALLLPFAAVLTGYLFARLDAIGTAAPGTPVIPLGAIGHRIHAIGLAMYQYTRLLLFPNVLEVDYYWAEGFLHPSGWQLQSGLGWILLGLALGWLYRRLPDLVAPSDHASAASGGRENLAKLGCCALATTLVFLFPVSHILPIGAFMAERLLFAPSLGFCVGVATLGRHALGRWCADAGRRRLFAVAALVLLVAAGGIRSRMRADEWRDDLGFWLAAERALPADSRVFANQASAYLELGRYGEARRAVDRALQSEPKVESLDRLLERFDRMLREEHGL